MKNIKSKLRSTQACENVWSQIFSFVLVVSLPRVNRALFRTFSTSIMSLLSTIAVVGCQQAPLKKSPMDGRSNRPAISNLPTTGDISKTGPGGESGPILTPQLPPGSAGSSSGGQGSGSGSQGTSGLPGSSGGASGINSSGNGAGNGFGNSPQIGGVVPPVRALPPIDLPKNEIPKIGVLLGAGGMKTWAQIGVLRQFQLARMPIHTISGLEWGAFHAAIYAHKNQVNDVEWQSMKLKDSDLPGSGLIGSKINRRSIGTLDSFFANVFADGLVEKTKVDFACPTTQIKGERTLWQNRGTIRGVLTRCVPYPPYFSDNADYTAAPFAIEEAAQWLRSRGAQVVILVNVLEANDMFSGRELEAQYTENLLWQEVRKQANRATPSSINHVINVNTSGHSLTDSAGRRALIEDGGRASADPVKALARKYGF
jgi:NTE family protein